MPHSRRPSKNIHYHRVDTVIVELPEQVNNGASRHYVRKASSYVKKLFRQITVNRASLRQEQENAKFSLLAEKKRVSAIHRMKPLNKGMYEPSWKRSSLTPIEQQKANSYVPKVY